jgi:tetratricopeptide (TPR) repeat protein
VNAAKNALPPDWRGVLKWEGRMDEMMDQRPDDFCANVLKVFSVAQRLGLGATGNTDHALSAIELLKRRAALLGKMERFRDQAELLCSLADFLISAGKRDQAAVYFQRARDLGAAHGFFSAECSACLGLGQMAMQEGRDEEGVELLRNALAAAPLNEGDDNDFELVGLGGLTSALFQTHAIDEVEPLVPRYREAAKAESQRLGYLGFNELQSLYASARLHEVLCTCTPCWEPPHTARPLHATKADSICYRIQRSVCTCTPCWESLQTVRPLHSTEAWRLVTGSTTPSKDTRNP